ncbi:MAG: histone deacetylase family protein [Azospirillaceae bacterium]|nr:histone deacetylase family protein [Azospirillaceae bacterium]
MQIIHAVEHRRHAGRVEMNAGRLVPCFETPQRVEIVLRHVDDAKLGPIVAPRDFGLAPLERVHDPLYLSFLATAHSEWRATHGDCDALPFSWPVPGLNRIRPAAIEGRLGYYSFAADTPITGGTWSAARHGAWCALTGAEALTAGERLVFSLSRPPGHHAARALFGGYCFLNNAAIAAQYLRDGGAARVAVLDVDYHHGNGTQEIFYDRADVLYVSLHSDPVMEFPFFLGHADEIGAGPGEGFNLNLPLPRGTGWPDYSAALTTALTRIRDFGADALILSFGADTFRGDPISRFLLDHNDFSRMGAAIGAIGLPTLVVLEGGYAVEDLGINTVNLLSAMQQ